jgi:hypothetical protein
MIQFRRAGLGRRCGQVATLRDHRRDHLRRCNNARAWHPIADLFENGEQPVAENKERLSRLRQSHKDAEAAITRLLSLVEQGVMEAEDASLKERLVSLKIRRDTRG